jgi:predicted phosphodiesterase
MTHESVRLALIGGIYSNYLALEQALVDARRRNVDGVFCLGDLGAFGPHPDRVFPLLKQFNVQCVQGNYDNSVGNGLEDCRCGYTDPRDNYFAQISYDYTLANTRDENRVYLRSLPPNIRLNVAGCRVLLCHGSPRRTNEFLWESTCSTHFLNRLLDDHAADVVAVTHTGIKWMRQLGAAKLFVNVGVLGRPENDGRTNVWYTELHVSGTECHVKFIPVEYDQRRLAEEMRAEQLPEEFVTTILTGWWTTCLDVLPVKERKRGKY